MLIRTITGTFAITLVLTLPIGAARAGEYHVYTCRTPAGEPAPADGWTGSVASGGAYDDYALNTCATGGALVAALGDQTTHLASLDLASWHFEVPSGRRVAAASLWRAGDTAGGATTNATYQFWLSSPGATEVFDECLASLQCHGEGEIQTPLSASNHVVIPGAHLGSSVFAQASCGGPSSQERFECKAGVGDPNGYAAVVYLYAADLTLEQAAGPTATGVSGELAAAPVVSGTSDLAFDATDPGAGVYEAVFSVDGRVIQSTVLDEAGGHCRNVGQTTDGLPAFLYLQPCPASVSADVAFDTTRVSDGTHHLVVSVVDAAGNSAPVLDRHITIANQPPAGVTAGMVSSAAQLTGAGLGASNGVGAATAATLAVSWKGTHSSHLSGPYGRPQTLVGRLTGPGGAPISGARIDVTATPSYVGAKGAAMTGPRTGADGRFSIRLPATASSRVLHISYSTHVGDPVPAATATLSLTVRAGLSLAVTPHRAAVGRTILFRGRLRGGPIPRGGMPLVLEARSGHGGWLEFHVTRTNARGDFRARYRFRFPGPVRYQFRVLCEAEADYPFAAGRSKVVYVLER